MDSLIGKVEFEQPNPHIYFEPTLLIHQQPTIPVPSSSQLKNETQSLSTISLVEKKINQKFKKKDEYMQISVTKEPEVVKWLIQDQQLESFSSTVIEEIKPIFQNSSSVEAYSIELKKEELPGLEDLTMYINLSKKVTYEEMMDLWKQISLKSIEIIKNIARNHHEVDDLLEKTTITLRRY